MKRLKCEIILLPMESGKNCIAIQHMKNGHNAYSFWTSNVLKEEPKDGYTINEANCIIPYNVYFVSTRKIRKGDLAMITKKDDPNYGYIVNIGPESNLEIYSKIEATTQKGLCHMPTGNYLPKYNTIGIHFLKKFCKTDGKMTHVMIDMFCTSCFNTGCVCGGIGYNCECSGQHECSDETLQPKVREDGTVICSEVKEYWDATELRQVIYAFCIDAKLISTSDEHIIIQIENFIQKKI